MVLENNVTLGEEISNNGIKIDLGYHHDKSEYKIFRYNYYNLDTFLKAIVTMPINYEVFSCPSSKMNDCSFSGTESFEEAWNLCRFGWDNGYDKFISKLNILNLKFSQIERLQNQYSCVGYVPNVAKFLCGNPKNIKTKINETVKKAIKINVEISYSAFTEIDAVINRGVCILSLITYLERLGIDCILEFSSTAVCEDEMIEIIVPIKRDKEKLNIKLSYFPLVHPSFLRRLIFRAIEIIPNCNNNWSVGYGYPYKKNDEEIKQMKNTIYISTPSEMGIYGENLNQDFDNFMNYINIKYNLNYLEGEDDKKCQKTYGRKVWE